MEEQKREMTGITIYFTRNDRKLLEMIVFIATLAGDKGIDIYHLAKIFFYAEKWHLNNYLRPIVGDTYIKMKYGPTPSAALDLIKGNKERNDINQELFELVKDALKVTENEKGHLWIRAMRQPNEAYFSESDKQVIRQAHAHCAERSFDELMEECHKESAWRKAEENGPMNYADLIEGPNKEELIKHLAEDGPFLSL